MIREILKMLNQYAVYNPTLPVQPELFPPFRDPGGMLSRSVGMPSRNDKPPDIWGHACFFRETFFVNPTASSSSPCPQGFNPWICNVSEHTSPHVTSERQTPDTILDPRCQSRPSARNSFDPSEGRFSKDYGTDQQRLQISDLHFDKFPTPITFACWKIRFKTEVGTCSKCPTEAMLWIKEVEMVESVDDLKSSCSIVGIRMQDFWSTRCEDCFSTETKSSIIPASRERSVWRNKRPKSRTVFLRGRQIAYLIYEYFRVTGANDSVENYADLFTIALRNDDIQEFDSKWDGILLSMTQIPSDDILQSLYKLRIRESENRIGIVQYGDSSEESWTWSSQIEDNGKKKCRAEFTNEEFWSQKWKLWKERRFSGISGQNKRNKEL